MVLTDIHAVPGEGADSWLEADEGLIDMSLK